VLLLLMGTKVGFFEARNFRILHPTIKDTETGQIWHFATMPGAEHCKINYNVVALAASIDISIFKPTYLA
jgi:hypothetical protein